MSMHLVHGKINRPAAFVRTRLQHRGARSYLLSDARDNKERYGWPSIGLKIISMALTALSDSNAHEVRVFAHEVRWCRLRVHKKEGGGGGLNNQAPFPHTCLRTSSSIRPCVFMAITWLMKSIKLTGAKSPPGMGTPSGTPPRLGGNPAGPCICWACVHVCVWVCVCGWVWVGVGGCGWGGGGGFSAFS